MKVFTRTTWVIDIVMILMLITPIGALSYFGIWCTVLPTIGLRG